MSSEYLCNTFLGHPTRFGNSCQLPSRGIWRKVWVQAASRRCDEGIRDGHASSWILLLQSQHISCDSLAELLRSRAKIGARRCTCIVPFVSRSRRTALEVTWLCKVLADERRADEVPLVVFDETTLCLAVEEHCGCSSGEQGISDAGQDQHDEGDANRNQGRRKHDYTKPIEVSSRSKSLIPANGATTPPTP